ncbi:hypothetical protein F4804DRAFT_350594 [Jackrogersella minutella]|nr:hypothetical protein F4804DRAFT_350594 [Jackrogersella minutella]
MARKNRNRHPKSSSNNRRAVSFDSDHLMHGAETSPTRNRNPPNRRGGKDQSFPIHGRGASPHHGGNNHNPFSVPQQQFQGNRGNPNHNRQNHNNNTNPNNKRNQRRGGNPIIAGDAAEDGLDEFLSSVSPLPFSSPPLFPQVFSHSNSHGDSHGGSGNTRSCTECSSVRRANLRFRNLAERALQACREGVAAWAKDAGVACDTADEMDWQPEPVTRVLLLRVDDGDARRERWPDEQQQQGTEGIGPVPVPGPWAWPPWREPVWPCRAPPLDDVLRPTPAAAFAASETCGEVPTRAAASGTKAGAGGYAGYGVPYYTGLRRQRVREVEPDSP